MTSFLPRWSQRRIAVLVALISLTLVACQPDTTGNNAAQSSPPPAVTVATPVKKEVVEWDEYTARIEAVEDVEVRARVSGYLERVAFEDGAVVEEGDLLFIIDRRPFEAELREREAQVSQARAAATNARTQFERGRRLRDSKSISEEEFTLRRTASLAAEADVQSAQAALEAARLNLEFTEVRAPISGRISRPFITQGNFVSGGTAGADLLTRIVSLDPIHAYFEASERAFLKYVRLSQSGQRPSSRDVKNPVFVQLADEEGFPHRGHIDFVDNLLDPNTGTMTGRALLPNPDGILTPGLFARLRLPGSGVQEALLVPDAAIGSDQTEKYVVVIGDDDAASYRRVEIGSIVHGLRLVRSGISETDRVVIAGLQRATPGQVVTPEEGTVDIQPEPLTPEDAQPVRVVAERAGG
ncbi:MAG: efflux RND transporter periplasmic adaptor subunit [Gammaproteobacteria bacterium]|nr:efflux RND transporter periplasmic adaptor subunit [Gammaproteobacteria bacterium]